MQLKIVSFIWKHFYGRESAFVYYLVHPKCWATYTLTSFNPHNITIKQVLGLIICEEIEVHWSSVSFLGSPPKALNGCARFWPQSDWYLNPCVFLPVFPFLKSFIINIIWLPTFIIQKCYSLAAEKVELVSSLVSGYFHDSSVILDDD